MEHIAGSDSPYAWKQWCVGSLSRDRIQKGGDLTAPPEPCSAQAISPLTGEGDMTLRIIQALARALMEFSLQLLRILGMPEPDDVPMMPAPQEVDSQGALSSSPNVRESLESESPFRARTVRSRPEQMLFHWRRMLVRARFRHRWAAHGFALKCLLVPPKRIDSRAPRGLTIQGQRWGWREIVPY